MKTIETIELIKEFMKTNKITQRKTAEILNIHESQLNRWLQHRCKISRLWDKEIRNKLANH